MNRNQLFAGIMVVLLIGSAIPMPVAAETTSKPDVVRYGADGQPSYIVKFDNSSASSVRDWANSRDSRTLVRLDNSSNTAVVAAPSWSVQGGVLKRIAAGSTEALLNPDVLSKKSYVESVYVNYELSYAEPVNNLQNVSEFSTPQEGSFAFDDPEFSKGGMAFDGDANRTTMRESRQHLGVNNVTATGKNQTVAVIDTGVNTADGLVFGNGTAGSTIRVSNASKNFLTNTTVNESGYDAVEDGNGHGTWTASAIAANTSNDVHDGIAPDATVLALKALDDEGSGSTADITRAIRYAADNNASVISMSLGSPVYSPAFEDAIQYAFDNGVSAVVVAVGNSRQTTRWVATPADVDGVIGVGATNGTTPSDAGSAYFSQIGPDPGTTDDSKGASQDAMVDVVAPGMKTTARVADTSGFTENSTLSGTSMATPMVAGGIAVALEANPSWEGDEKTVRKWVRDGARPVPHAATSEVGQGMFAADNTITETVPSTSQEASMTGEADARDSFYQSLSDSSGGLLPLALEPASVGA